MAYNYPCEYCEGTVEPKRVDQEAFKHKDGFIILEDVVIGVCQSCGNRYYSAEILKTVHRLASGEERPDKVASVPVGRVA